MMSERALLFGDLDTAAQGRQVSHPGTAKRLGRPAVGFDEHIWAERLTGNLAKFGQYPALRGFLLTGKVLVEVAPQRPDLGNWPGRIRRSRRGPLALAGLNLLGFALMEVRHQLGTAN